MDKLNRILQDDQFLNDLGKFLQAKTAKDGSLISFLTEKRFTIKNVDTTYRLINHWSTHGLFEDTRAEKKGWRKFSLVDMVWLKILIDLRTFGLPLDKIKVSFKSLQEKMTLFEFAITSSMLGKGMNIVVFSDGELEIGSRNSIARSESLNYLNQSAYLVVSLNRCLSHIFPSKDFTPCLDSVELSEKEISTLYEFRVGNPKKVSACFKKGVMDSLEVTTKEKVGNTSAPKPDFGERSIVYEDGKTISVTTTRRIKL